MLIHIKNFFLQSYFRFLGRQAHYYLKKHQVLTIGINGSVGKTSCRMIVTQTLQQAFPHLRISTSPKNFNGELGLPLSIFEISEWSPSLQNFLKVAGLAMYKRFFGKKNYDILVLEYGIDRPGEMDFLLSIHKPIIGIFTAIDAVHSEQFGDPAAIARDEVKMAMNTKELVFLNLSDPYAQQLKNQLAIDILTYQTLDTDPVADLTFQNTTFSSTTERLVLASVDAKIRDQNYSLQTNLLSKPDFAYLVLALTLAEIVAFRFGVSDFDLKKLTQNPLLFQLQPGRSSIFPGKSESVLLDSSYNASPLSMRRIIDTALLLKKQAFPQHKLLLVLGDMRELGELTEKEHRLLAGYVHQSADQVFLLGSSMKKYLKDELEKISYPKDLLQHFSDYRSLAQALQDFLEKSEEQWLVVIKGSQNTIFLEEVVKALLKNPEDYSQLTRQSSWWMKKKGVFLDSLSLS